jgi:hypothetical protein
MTARVAGEAEKVARVVHELVDVVVAAERRRDALVYSHEVGDDQGEQGREDEPEARLRQRRDDRCPGRSDLGKGEALLTAPPSGIVSDWGYRDGASV